MTSSYTDRIARELNLSPGRVKRTIDLLDSGNTLPFIARYRKEATGEMDEEQLRNLVDWLGKLRALDDRRTTILEAIAAQEQLSPKLEKEIRAADTLTELEDLYQPYKQRRHTRAERARQQGLQPLADLIVAQQRPQKSLSALARPFVNGDDLPDTEAVWAGARDIVAEQISDHPRVRGPVRGKAMQYGVLKTSRVKATADEKRQFDLYYDFSQRVDRIRPHQTLAVNRAEAEKVIRVSVEIAQRDWLRPVAAVFLPQKNSPLYKQLDMAIHDAAQRLLLPAIERDVRRHLTDTAEEHAIQVFADNLRGLLTQPPLTGHTVMGIDPAYRSGCKVAVIDPTGRVLDSTAVYPHPPQNKRAAALNRLQQLIEKYAVTLIAIGNGTASRETEQLAADLIRQVDGDLRYLIVNEAGASVYSASRLAKQELPDLDVTIRGAVSIGRRVQDPLAELVKIDPKAIGVGLYQHDVNQKQLAEALDLVVTSVVNRVGVDVNSASPALLTYVSGIGPTLADRIVAYRDENGPFTRRRDLLEVKGIGAKSFQQAAGFVRVRDGDNWLDGSAIHPESYEVAEKIIDRAGITPAMSTAERQEQLDALNVETVAADLDAGVPTVRDIFEQLVRPGRDPREELPPPVLRQDVLSMDDLKVGMRLKGTVRNVVDFGAFIDIGVKQDGLLHRSQIPNNNAWPTVGDVLPVTILKLEPKRGRIGLGWPE